MAVNVQKSPQDLTGRRKAVLEAEAADQQRAAAARMSMVTAEAEKNRDDVIDLTDGDSVLHTSADGTKNVEVKEETRNMRVNTTLENVTIGHGTNYNFEVGQTYKVPKRIYDYLDEKDFVWH